MTIKASELSTYIVAEDLGDWTTYHVTLGELNNAVRVTIGGAHPPFIGGVVPNEMIESFNSLVFDWAQGIHLKHPQDLLFNWGPFLHLSSKQAKGYFNKWDLVVAIIFAWLFYWKEEQNEDAVLIIGHLYNNRQEEAKHILEKVMEIAY